MSFCGFPFLQKQRRTEMTADAVSLSASLSVSAGKQLRDPDQLKYRPFSMTRFWPVMQRLMSQARKRAP